MDYNALVEYLNAPAPTVISDMREFLNPHSEKCGPAYFTPCSDYEHFLTGMPDVYEHRRHRSGALIPRVALRQPQFPNLSGLPPLRRVWFCFHVAAHLHATYASRAISEFSPSALRARLGAYTLACSEDRDVWLIFKGEINQQGELTTEELGEQWCFAMHVTAEGTWLSARGAWSYPRSSYRTCAKTVVIQNKDGSYEIVTPQELLNRLHMRQPANEWPTIGYKQ